MKCAQSLNGKIASFNGKPKWISGAKSRTLVHQLRSEYDSILVGAQTVIKDNPSLTVRLVKGRNPHKIVIDGKFRTTLNYKVYQQNDDKKTYANIINWANFKRVDWNSLIKEQTKGKGMQQYLSAFKA